MANDTAGSRKRKFEDLNGFKPKFVYLKAHATGKAIAIHENHFWAHVKTDEYLSELKTERDGAKTYITALHVTKEVSVLKGLAFWMYHQKLPSESMIENINYADDWVPDNDREEEPLTMRMALELYSAAWALDIWNLHNDIMTYLFGLYMKPGALIPTAHLKMIFQDSRLSEHAPIKAFFIDIYFKKNLEQTEDFARTFGSDEVAEYPLCFLYGIFKRQSWLNYHHPHPNSAAATAREVDPSRCFVTRQEQAQPWVMRLLENTTWVLTYMTLSQDAEKHAKVNDDIGHIATSAVALEDTASPFVKREQWKTG
ncbi:hypothetical protein K491DRAFT_681337 [Lophiostoma macrostomum CBS 122681]|uniref:BTB domain-containing protein n=1 Tax=Lophiostoma macrostomum CBS 122681 TaxID=1314788 RepID=A0A6A6T0T8_9PLEO|nr:hypothetical protein K491DRAFT_681337 [Lophiostoma macrostomum CBS 122681]